MNDILNPKLDDIGKTCKFNAEFQRTYDGADKDDPAYEINCNKCPIRCARNPKFKEEKSNGSI